jgi:arylsulfatase A-like enzyme
MYLILVYILTDDQDVKLGSLDVQPMVKSLIIDEGMFFNNAFVATPVCCPSR